MRGNGDKRRLVTTPDNRLTTRQLHCISPVARRRLARCCFYAQGDLRQAAKGIQQPPMVLRTMP
jgi:hypothetical protein